MAPGPDSAVARRGARPRAARAVRNGRRVMGEVSCNRIFLGRPTSRNLSRRLTKSGPERPHPQRLLHATGGGLGRVAPAPEVVGANGADDRRAGVLGNDQAAQRLGRERLGGVEPDGGAVRHAQRIDRDRAARRQRHALGAARADRRVGERLLAKEDEAGIGADHLVDALGMAARPGADRRPRRVARAQLALIDQPAADRLVRLVVVRRVSDADDRRPAARGRVEDEAARALDLQHEGIERIAHPGDLAAAQASLRRRQALDLAPRPVRVARREVGRRRIERDAKARARLARGLDQRLEVAGRQPAGVVRRRLDAIGAQGALQPGAQCRLGRRAAEAAAPRVGAGAAPLRARPLAAAREREPELLQPIGVPARQLAPRDRDPARARPIDRRRGEVVAIGTGRSARRRRRGGDRRGRRRRHARAADERRRERS